MPRGSNPVSAFLAGFQAVDALETNRQNRAFREKQMAFAEEDQSRTRRMWKRQDDEYELLKLERYRSQKLAELDATVQAIIMEMPSEQLTKMDEMAIMQEAHKRMQANDPSFGEHVALAHGLDPAAGSAIRDKNKPINGFGFAPGKGTFFEVDSVNGMQPYTENRTSADNDPVAFRQPGLQELIGIYGPGVMQNDLAIAARLRALVGADEVTGNPLGTQDKRARQPEVQQPNTVDPVAEQERAQVERGGYVEASEEDIEKRKQLNAENDAQRRRTKDKAVVSQYEEVENKLRDIMTDPNAQTGERLVAGAKKLAIDLFGGGQGEQRDWVANPPTQEEIDGSLGAMFLADMAHSAEKADKFGGFLHDKIHEFVYGIDSPDKGKTFSEKLSGVLGNEVTAAAKPGYPGAKTRDTAATTTKDIVADGNVATDFTPDKLSQPGEDAGKAVMRSPPPGNAKAAAGAARSVAAPVKGKRPTLVQMYNAVGLAKLNLISTEQLHRYASTGQLNEAAKADIQVLQADGWARIFDKNTQSLSAPFKIAPGGEGGDPATVSDHAAIQNLYQDTLQSIEDPGYQQKVIDAMLGAAGILLDVPSTSKVGVALTANAQVRSQLRHGVDLMLNFDEDKIQGLIDNGDLDLSWGDFKPAMNAGNVAIATAIADNVKGDKEITYAMRDYMRDFKQAFGGMTEGAIVNRVHKHEKTIKEAMTKANKQKGPVTFQVLNGETVTVTPKDSKHDIRQKILVALSK